MYTLLIILNLLDFFTWRDVKCGNWILFSTTGRKYNWYVTLGLHLTSLIANLGLAGPVSLQLVLVDLTVKRAEKGEEWFLFELVACIVRGRESAAANVPTSSKKKKKTYLSLDKHKLQSGSSPERYSCSGVSPQKKNGERRKVTQSPVTKIVYKCNPSYDKATESYPN